MNRREWLQRCTATLAGLPLLWSGRMAAKPITPHFPTPVLLPTPDPPYPFAPHRFVNTSDDDVRVDALDAHGTIVHTTMVPAYSTMVVYDWLPLATMFRSSSSKLDISVNQF